ncbi:MAG: hypothetical protein AB7T22_03900 [Calditrichaceae bacterium]
MDNRTIISGTYRKLILPAFILIAILYFARLVTGNQIRIEGTPGFISPGLFFTAGLFSIILPLVYRLVFIGRVRHKKKLERGEFLKFEKTTLYIASISAYILFIACLYDIYKIHLAGTALFVFYAVYYYYPSKKRISTEEMIFRVDPNT